MRSSSMKSLLSALSIAVTLFFAVPSAHARTAAPQRETRTSRESADIMRAIRRLLSRISEGFTTNSGPTIPIPTKPAEETNGGK